VLSRALPDVDLRVIEELVARGGTQTEAVREYWASLNAQPPARKKRPRKKR